MERELRKTGKFSPVMAALLAVLVLAGCTLTLLVIQFRRNTAGEEQQQAKDAAIAQQLEDIQAYLAVVDTTLAKGEVSDTEGYESLSGEVEAMQQNLTEYRDNNVIADDAIGQNLDDVITQLAEIQENLEKERRTSEDLKENMSTAGNTISASTEESRRSAEQLQQTVDTQLSDVREDIRKLIRDASGENQAEYEELLNVLNGADSDLENLEKTAAANQEKIQAAISSGVGSISGSVSGVRGSIALLQETLNALKEENVQLQAQCTAVLEGQGTLQNTMAAERQNVVSSVEAGQSEQEDRIMAALDELSDRLESFGSAESAEVEDEIKELQDVLENKDADLKQLQQLLEEQNGLLQEYQKCMDNQSQLLEEHGKLLKDLWDANEENKLKEQHPSETTPKEPEPSVTIPEDTDSLGEQGGDENAAENDTADDFTGSDREGEEP